MIKSNKSSSKNSSITKDDLLFLNHPDKHTENDDKQEPTQKSCTADIKCSCFGKCTAFDRWTMNDRQKDDTEKNVTTDMIPKPFK